LQVVVAAAASTAILRLFTRFTRIRRQVVVAVIAMIHFIYVDGVVFGDAFSPRSLSSTFVFRFVLGFFLIICYFGDG